jgi:hypothetical protein
MLKFLPVGFIGLMVGGLIAANSSTNLTHLNWGASYLVHDFYRRFLKKDATERHYVMVGRLATVALFFSAGALVFVLETAKDSFDISPKQRRDRSPLSRPLVDGGQRLVRDRAMINSFGFVLLLILRRPASCPNPYALIQSSWRPRSSEF